MNLSKTYNQIVADYYGVEVTPYNIKEEYIKELCKPKEKCCNKLSCFDPKKWGLYGQWRIESSFKL